ncbi:MAG: hypothetical protein AAGL68_11195, partial [Pseudomonadota bacterium]
MTKPPVTAPDIPEADADNRLKIDNCDADALIAKADHRLLAADLRAASAYSRAGQKGLDQSRRGSGG